VLRAEIWAAISALTWVLESGTQAILWVDNQQVHTNLESFRKGFNPCNNACSDDDLWTQAHELCTLAVERNLLIKNVKVKAKAHEDSMEYSDPIEQWALRGNHAADGAAEAARTLFPLQCWHVWNDLRIAYQTKLEWRKAS
jgi:ribonuclease HI